MRVPEISLGYGLLAQNKHDLCRYYKYTERHKQTQYLPAYTVSFMVVPSVRAWEFRVATLKPKNCFVFSFPLTGILSTVYLFLSIDGTVSTPLRIRPMNVRISSFISSVDSRIRLLDFSGIIRLAVLSFTLGLHLLW